MNATPMTHFSNRASTLVLFSQGIGACTEEGIVTAFTGLVTCPECAEIAVAVLLETADKLVREMTHESN
jgi:hypothetical protein